MRPVGRIVLDCHGSLRKNIFYRFDVPFDDGTDGLPRGKDWIVVPRTPTDDELSFTDPRGYLYIDPIASVEDRKLCPKDPAHATRSVRSQISADFFGGSRSAAFVPANMASEFLFAVSEDFRARLEQLKVKGARLDPIAVNFNQSAHNDPKGFAFQFVGRASLRKAKLVDASNRCPHCGNGPFMCEHCGYWYGVCSSCKQVMAASPRDRRSKDDKRFIIEEDVWRVLEGNTWDGSDLVQAGAWRFASKRFIDWLLRVHAAPFYAEPVWLCVDGMSDEQKRWLDQLAKPLEG